MMKSVCVSLHSGYSCKAVAWVNLSFICVLFLNRALVRHRIYRLVCMIVFTASGVGLAQDENTFRALNSVKQPKTGGVDDTALGLLDYKEELSSATTLRDTAEPPELCGMFSRAIRQGDVALLERLLVAGVSLDHWEGTGDDGLVAYSIRQKASEMGVLLLRYGADPNRWGYEGASPLQMAIATGDSLMVKALLGVGADPDELFARPVTESLLAIAKDLKMQWFLKNERRVTPLMMAMNQGDLVMIRSLLDHGAERYIRSGRYKLSPLNFASRRGDVKAMQVMLGEDPSKEKFYIVLDLSDQRLRLFDSHHQVVFSSRVSTGRGGYRTPKGEFVITDKHKNHRSTIYNVKMPYFQRLSCSAIGFHAGYVPGYPASHGCIRMPYQSAKQLFNTTPAGTRVVIQD